MRSPYQAARELQQQIQREIACVSETVVRVSKGGYEPSAPNAPDHSLSPAQGQVRLAGSGRLSLQAALQYRLVPAPGSRDRWQVEVVAYQYALVDRHNREIIAYHWHPKVETVIYPHLHVGHGTIPSDFFDRLRLSRDHNALRADLAAAHLPAGPIELRTVLRLAIEQFRVLPRPAHRGDWRTILAR